MASPSAWTFYRPFKLRMANGTIDLDSHTFYVALLTSTYTPDVEAHAAYSDLTNEVSNVNTGYTTGGATGGVGLYTRATTTCTFDIGDVTWTAGSAGLTCRTAVIYDFTDAGKSLVAYSTLDSAPADVVVATGNSLTIQITNVFTLT